MNRNIVIVDIDGTIAAPGDRLKYLQQKPKDWDAFYEACDQDKPIKKIISLLYRLDRSGCEIVFCTGRRESVRRKTEEWLTKHYPETYMGVSIRKPYKLLMRKDGDFRTDYEAKPELLDEAGIKLDNIYMVLEDRNSMVEKFRSMGLTVLQVADGDF